ncbi:MAG: hypothetical protein HYU69_05705 [Bacteroidetes bacterium]|nr:hypothetical protein [Bacteroidota bacterium]
MKTPSDDLFILIKSMNSREKIFFKAYSVKGGSRQTSRSYLKLFDVINNSKGKAYDTQLLKSELKKIGFFHNLKKAKEYLTKAILKSLTEYHSDTSENIQIRALLDQAEVLVSKKIYKMAKTILLKAEKLIIQHEKYGFLLEICSIRSTIARETANQMDLEYVTNEQIKNERKYSDYVRNRIEYKHLADKVHYLFNESDGKELNQLRIQEIINSPLLASPKAALTHSAIKDYYNIHFQVSFFLLKEYNSTVAYKRQEEWIKYLESNNSKNRAHEYLNSLSNNMIINSIRGDYKKCDDVLNKASLFLNSLSSKRRTKELQLKMFSLTLNYMVSQIKCGALLKAIEVGKGITIDATAENPNRIALWDNFFSAYFLSENYHEALKYLNKIIAFKQKYRQDIQAMARIYLLITHYELEHNELLPYMAKQARHFLMKTTSFTEFEKRMIYFFEKEIHRYEKKQEQIIGFGILKQQLGIVFKNPKYSHFPEYFDVISWIESKIENRPFAELVKEKALRKNS